MRIISGILTVLLTPIIAYLAVFKAWAPFLAHYHYPSWVPFLAHHPFLVMGPTMCWVLVGLATLYGVEAGILTIYDLASGLNPQVLVGWLSLLIDLTWSLPNTVFGFVFGNLIYIFFAVPDRNASQDNTWIVFLPGGGSGFGNTVLQTLGTVNLGGSGQHERVHLYQARIFGPFYLLIFGLNYAFNFAVQLVWSLTIGLVLWALNIRDTPWFRPFADSAVKAGPLGWIYRSTLFELWAYAT